MSMVVAEAYATYVKCQVSTWFRKTFNDESGAAEVVATLVIIGIALALALIFREKLVALVKNLWNQLVSNGDTSAKSAKDVAGGDWT